MRTFRVIGEELVESEVCAARLAREHAGQMIEKAKTGPREMLELVRSGGLERGEGVGARLG